MGEEEEEEEEEEVEVEGGTRTLVGRDSTRLSETGVPLQAFRKGGAGVGAAVALERGVFLFLASTATLRTPTAATRTTGAWRGWERSRSGKAAAEAAVGARGGVAAAVVAAVETGSLTAGTIKTRR